MILNRFHYSLFAKSAWYENGGVSITPFSFVFISFVRTRFETEDVLQIVVAAFSNDSVFGVSIENDAFSYVSIFKSLHFEQRFQMSPFSIAFNGNINPKTETFHSVFIRKWSNGNGASLTQHIWFHLIRKQSIKERTKGFYCHIQNEKKYKELQDAPKTVSMCGCCGGAVT